MSQLPASLDIERIRQKINGLLARLQKAQDDAWSLFRHGEREAAKVKGYYTAALVAKKSKLAQLLAELPVQYVAGWQDVRWLSWEADTVRQERILRELRVGEMVEQKENIAVPGYVPFIGGNRTVIIACNNATSVQALELLQSLVIRTSFLLPHDSRYRLLDPAGLGQAFPMQSYLLQAQIPVETNGHDVARDLETVIEDIKSINRTMLTPSITSFDQVPHENRVNWRYQLIFVADFPRVYDERAIKVLQQIADAGPRAGVYLFIHWNRHYDLPRDMKGKDEELFANAFFLNLKYVGNNFRYIPDQAPTPTWQEQIFTKLSQSKQQEEHIDWERYVGLKQTDWWNASASLRIETPVGLGRGGKPLDIWFGERNRDIQTHGVLAGMTGSGKSNFCHALICGLAVRYSPDALRLYLIDGKQGVEFKVYSDLPHAEVVSLYSEAELSRNVLAELVREMERRNNEFFKPEGVTTLAEYHHKGQRRGNLPRILLLIDEYQELFEQDHDGSASRYLRHLAQKGRNAGIHIVLASTRYTVSDMQYRGDILNNIQLRMMLKMTDAEVQTLEDFGPRGKSLLQRLCDKSGMVVIKDQLGDDDSAYRPGKVAFLDKDAQLPRIVKELGNRDSRRPLVFDGKEQPGLCANPQFQRLLNAPIWLDAQGMESYAHAPIRAGGLGKAEWYEIEVPRVCWLGQEFNVHGHTNVIFRRRSRQNVVLLGEANPPRYGMLTAMLAGLSVSGNPDNTKFSVMDFSPTGAEWSDILLKLAEKLPADFTCHATKASDLAQVYLADLINVLDERKQHRVALRMAENDLLRFGFVQSRHVAELQSADSEPICALYLDIESSKDVLFKPYIVDSSKATSITRDIEEIGQHLIRRSRTP